MSTARRFQILVCDGPSCGVTHESERLVAAIDAVLAERGIDRDRAATCAFTCFGRCDDGPNLFVRALGPAEAAGVEPRGRVIKGQRGLWTGMDEPRCRALVEAWIDGRQAELGEPEVY